MPRDVLVPLGRPLGVVGVPPVAVFEVALGDDIIALDAAAFAAWEIAGQAGRLLSGQEIVLARAARRLGGPADDLQALLATGALVPLGERDVDRLRLARDTRFVPLLTGIDVADDEPHWPGFGANDSEVLRIPPDIFEIAVFAHLHRCLGDAVVAQARASARQPVEVLAEFIHYLPSLIGVGAGYLDLALTAAARSEPRG